MAENIESAEAAQDIAAELAALQAKKVALEEDIEVKLIQRRADFIQGLRDEINASGYNPREIIMELGGRKKKPPFRLKDDHSKTHGQGKLPKWLKSRMVAAGLDPDKAADRAAFKAQSMEPAEG
jgi:DNA-binding protein H-NS